MSLYPKDSYSKIKTKWLLSLIFAVCMCPCERTKDQVVVNNSVLQAKIKAIKRELSIKTRKLSRTLRKKTSATDARISSVFFWFNIVYIHSESGDSFWYVSEKLALCELCIILIFVKNMSSFTCDKAFFVSIKMYLSSSFYIRIKVPFLWVIPCQLY